VDIWKELQIEKTSDRTAIRRAYARRLKKVHPEDDPQGFQTLRAAYEAAINYSSYLEYEWDEDSTDEGDTSPENAALDIIVRRSQTDDAFIDVRNAQDASPSENEVHKYVQDLMRIIDKNGEFIAAEHLSSIKASPEMENLETRHSFDDLLIETLYRKDPIPFYFLERALGLLKVESRSQTVGSDLDYRHYYLLERLKGRHSYKRLLEIAGSNGKLSKKDVLSFNILTPDQVFVAKTLTGQYDPRTFRLIALLPWKRRRIIQSIENMKITAPELLKYELNSDTVGWWQNFKESADRRANKIKRYMKAFILLLLSSCFLAPIAYKAGERFGRIVQIGFMAVAALTPTAFSLLWKPLIKETAAGRLALQAADRIGKIFFPLIVFALLIGIIIALVQTELRGFSIALVITIGLISRLISEKYKLRK
jgi:hypothetical protein